MKCENCTKYDDCRTGSGLTWPCGAYRPKTGGGMDNEKLIEQLRTESLYADKASLEIMDLCMDAATALSTLQAENSRLRAELEYEREHANAYYEECGQWEAENEKLRNEVERQRRSADDRKHLYENAERAYMKVVAELEQVKRERDAAVKAVKNMAEYIVCAGRVDYFLCDEISQEHHLKYQPKNDGNYDNEPCYKCIADWFLQGHEWQENC